MGAVPAVGEPEVALEVESDKRSLQSVRASGMHRRPSPRPHPILASRAQGALFLAFAAFGVSCGGSPSPTPTDESASERERAAAIVAGGPLPARAETVALADAIAIASSKKGKTADGAAFARLAGDLRT